MPLSYFWALVFSYTIGIAAIIGLVRFKKILKSYRLFVVFACLALFSELISTVMIEVRHNNAIVANIYVLLEPLILLGLFYQWRAFQQDHVHGSCHGACRHLDLREPGVWKDHAHQFVLPAGICIGAGGGFDRPDQCNDDA
jgi:hypothetical protein